MLFLGSHWVLGVEGQYSWSDLKGDHQNTDSGTAEQFFFPFPLTIHTTGSITDRFSSDVRDIATIAGRRASPMAKRVMSFDRLIRA